jgi:hypothetical protein
MVMRPCAPPHPQTTMLIVLASSPRYSTASPPVKCGRAGAYDQRARLTAWQICIRSAVCRSAAPWARAASWCDGRNRGRPVGRSRSLRVGCCRISGPSSPLNEPLRFPESDGRSQNRAHKSATRPTPVLATRAVPSAPRPHAALRIFDLLQYCDMPTRVPAASHFLACRIDFAQDVQPPTIKCR